MQGQIRSRTRRAASLFALPLLFGLVPSRCAAADDDGPEAYKFKFNAQWWIARPNGLQGNTGPIDVQRDFNFGDYNIFYGLMEWKPRRKHHLLFYIAPIRVPRITSLPGRLSASNDIRRKRKTPHRTEVVHLFSRLRIRFHQPPQGVKLSSDRAPRTVLSCLFNDSVSFPAASSR
jgi:hypothetical protein